MLESLRSREKLTKRSVLKNLRTLSRTETTGHNAPLTSGKCKWTVICREGTWDLSSLNGKHLQEAVNKTWLSLMSLSIVLLPSASVLSTVQTPPVNTQTGGWLLVFWKGPAEAEWRTEHIWVPPPTCLQTHKHTQTHTLQRFSCLIPWLSQEKGSACLGRLPLA